MQQLTTIYRLQSSPRQLRENYRKLFTRGGFSLQVITGKELFVYLFKERNEQLNTRS